MWPKHLCGDSGSDASRVHNDRNDVSKKCFSDPERYGLIRPFWEQKRQASVMMSPPRVKNR